MAHDARSSVISGDVGQLATVAIVPRERFSVAQRSLESVLSLTPASVPIVYVDGRGPRDLRQWLDEKARQRPFNIVRSERYLSPSQARNIALKHVRTRYVVFADNDVIVSPGWLEALVRCAEETGAVAVGPLMYEGDASSGVVHNAGGMYEFVGPMGERDLVQHNEYGHKLRSQIPAAVGRRRVDYVEFHCMLIRMSLFEKIGMLDEGLLSTREHLDLCLRAGEVGGEIWSEMDSTITYENPPPVTLTDLPFFILRWSEAWNDASLKHFSQKYGLGEKYMERAWGSRLRRLAVFHQLNSAAGRVAGPRAARTLMGAVGYVERVFNKAAVAFIARRFAARPSTTGI